MGLFTMPRLGADMERGTLLEWRVAPGDTVTKGDIVALIDTEKSTVDIEVFESGTVTELLVEPGTEVEVGTPLARITVADGEAAEPSHVSSPLVRHRAEQLHVDLADVAGTGPGHRVTRDDVERAALPTAAVPTAVPTATPGSTSPGASPRARRRAAELGVDIAAVAGSGPAGAVRERDLPAAAATPTAPPAATRDSDRSSRMRQAIARQMAISNRDIPHYHLTSTIDLHAALEWLADHNQGRPAADRVLPAALLVAAAARAMTREPDLNGSWVDDGFVPASGVHAATAVALRGGGLLAPVIHDADRLGVDEVMASLHDLVTRSRRGGLRGSDLSGASFTITDLGERGADAVLGVIHPPQVALVGFGGIVERPWAVAGMLAVRPTVTVTLSADHRATDGHVGSRYLAALRDLLDHPDRLESR